AGPGTTTGSADRARTTGRSRADRPTAAAPGAGRRRQRAARSARRGPDAAAGRRPRRHRPKASVWRSYQLGIAAVPSIRHAVIQVVDISIHLGRLPGQELLNGAVEARIREPVPGPRRGRREAAADLVLALNAGLELREPLANAV